MALEPILLTFAIAFLLVTGALVFLSCTFVFSADPGRRDRAREAAQRLSLLLRQLIRPPR